MVFVPRDELDKVEYGDIPMFGDEMGATEDEKTSHPKLATQFRTAPTTPRGPFDLVIADGAFVGEDDDIKPLTQLQLLVSQLVFGMNRIKNGGTFFFRLHQFEEWDTLLVLHKFSKFSEMKLCKPSEYHGKVSSFYVVAQKVDPGKIDAKEAVKDWQRMWKAAIFRGCREYVEGEDTVEDVKKVLKDFGEKYRELGTSVINVQLPALQKFQDEAKGKGSGSDGRNWRDV